MLVFEDTPDEKTMSDNRRRRLPGGRARTEPRNGHV